MEFENYSCPICNKKFTPGDDVVVCPECGTPQHRECYESCGHCFYEDKHASGFSFEKDEEKADKESAEKTIVCPNCQSENPSTSFYCQKCGHPLLNNDQSPNSQPFGQQPNNPNNPNMNFPFGGMPYSVVMDPMAGFKSDEPVGDNVTAGELSKFVGKNTNYFMRIFRTILKFNKSRFNFSAFLLSGAYFLYRKMYALGALFSAIVLVLTVSSVFIQSSSEYSIVYEIFSENSLSAASSTAADMFAGLSSSEVMLLFAPGVLELINFIVMITAGLIANRTYFKHCIGKITKIKAENTVTDGSGDVSEKIESGGGVNLPIIIAALVVYTVVNYMPLFL